MKSEMGELIETQKNGFPETAKHSTCDFDPLPYFLVGDEIFPLKTWLMRPYPGSLDNEHRISNYRLSRARRTIGNAFGILCACWRTFYTPIRAKVENVENFVLACLALHNYLRLRIMHHIVDQVLLTHMMILAICKKGNGEH